MLAAESALFLRVKAGIAGIFLVHLNRGKEYLLKQLSSSGVKRELFTVLMQSPVHSLSLTLSKDVLRLSI